MRLDLLLFEKGIYPSREKAKQAVQIGRVKVDGKIVNKPSADVNENACVEALPFEFVSRGGYKLQKALEEFGVSLAGKVVLDIGASTGGFTDVCLLNGAGKVYAVDTGEGQLATKLRADSRVVNLEKTNYLDFSAPEDISAVVIDVSFISLTKLAAKLASDFLKKNVDIIALVKPQFEVGLQYAKKHNGVVKDEKTRAKVLENVCACFKQQGFEKKGVITSPIKGGDGNVEYLLWLKGQRESEK